MATAESKGCLLSELSLDCLKEISPHFTEDIMSIWNYENSVEQYTSVGGTSKHAVMKQIEEVKNICQQLQ